MKKYLLSDKKSFFKYVFIIPIAAIVNIGLSFVLKSITDTVINQKYDQFVSVATFAVIYIVLDALMDYLPRKYRAKLTQATIYSLRQDLIYRIEKIPLNIIETNGKSKYYSKLINDLEIIENEYINTILCIYFSITTFIFSLITSILLQPLLTIIMVCIAILPALFAKCTEKILSDSKKNVLESKKKYLFFLDELFLGFSTLKFSNRFNSFNKKNKKINKDIRDSNYNFTQKQSLVYAISYGLGQMVCLGTWIIGALFIINGKLDLPDLIAITTLMGMIAGPIQYITDYYTSIISSKEITKELIAFIKNEECLSNNKIIIDKINNIKFSKVQFSNKDNKEILKNINLNIEMNKKYVVIGESGAGKSTLLNLLTGKNIANKGKVFINDICIDNISKESLFEKISIIEQKSFIFDGTLKDNVTLFKNINDENVLKALNESGFDEWLIRNKFNISLNIKKGINSLSGGEERRLDMARTLLKNSDIYIYDEPTTGLDKYNAHLIEQKILNLDKTVIVITHNNSYKFLTQFDYIIEVKNNTIFTSKINKFIQNKET